ncbi:Acid sugar phosphatase [Candidatus Entotheonellaceae bacterium PAL068K]
MIKHVVMDMDGVLYRGDLAVPGAVETIQALHGQGVEVAYLTNNASRHRDELVAKMTRLGIPCTIEQMWGSAYTAARYLAAEAPEARIFAVGMPGLIRELREAGLTVLPTHEQVTHVVAGLDRGVTYEKLKQAHYAICNGAQFIATNLDATFPDTPTTTTPGAGAIVAVLRTSTGVEPLVMGKPQTTGISQLATAWGVGPREMAAVGDRLDTDIASARAFGCLAVLVLTGITRRMEAEHARGVQAPDVILRDLTELPPLLQHPPRVELTRGGMSHRDT